MRQSRVYCGESRKSFGFADKEQFMEQCSMPASRLELAVVVRAVAPTQWPPGKARNTAAIESTYPHA